MDWSVGLLRVRVHDLHECVPLQRASLHMWLSELEAAVAIKTVIGEWPTALESHFS